MSARLPAVPASCKALDRRAVERALVDSRGSVSKAARSLSVPSGHLRRLIWATPWLADAAFEQIEQAIDEAHAAVREALRSPAAAVRLAAAAHILRANPAALRRGWGTRRAAASSAED